VVLLRPLTPVVYAQAGFLGRNDDGNEITATPKAAENANWSQAVDENFRVRFVIDEIVGGTVNSEDVLQLQYRHNGDTWTDVNATSLVARSAASPNLADNSVLTRQLTSGSGTFQAGQFDEVNGLTTMSGDLTGDELTEVEYCLQLRSTDVADADTVELRVIRQDTLLLNQYSQIPSITVTEGGPVEATTEEINAAHGVVFSDYASQFPDRTDFAQELQGADVSNDSEPATLSPNQTASERFEGQVPGTVLDTTNTFWANGTFTGVSFDNDMLVQTASSRWREVNDGTLIDGFRTHNRFFYSFLYAYSQRGFFSSMWVMRRATAGPSIRIENDGTLAIHDGPGSIVAQTTTVLPTNSWMRLEVTWERRSVPGPTDSFYVKVVLYLDPTSLTPTETIEAFADNTAFLQQDIGGIAIGLPGIIGAGTLVPPSCAWIDDIQVSTSEMPAPFQTAPEPGARPSTIDAPYDYSRQIDAFPDRTDFTEESITNQVALWDVAYDQVGFRGRNDDGNEATATWKAAENANWSQAVDVNFRIRFAVQETADGNVGLNTALQLQRRLNAGAWENVELATGTAVRVFDSPNVLNNQQLTRQLTSGTGTYQPGGFDENNGQAPVGAPTLTGNFDHLEVTEVEYSLRLMSADVINGDIIEFRLVDNVGNGPIDAYTQTPVITVIEAGEEASVEILVAADPNYSKAAETFIPDALTSENDANLDTGFIFADRLVDVIDTTNVTVDDTSQVDRFETVEGLVAANYSDFQGDVEPLRAPTWDDYQSTTALDVSGFVAGQVPPTPIEVLVTSDPNYGQSPDLTEFWAPEGLTVENDGTVAVVDTAFILADRNVDVSDAINVVLDDTGAVQVLGGVEDLVAANYTTFQGSVEPLEQAGLTIEDSSTATVLDTAYVTAAVSKDVSDALNVTVDDQATVQRLEGVVGLVAANYSTFYGTVEALQPSVLTIEDYSSFAVRDVSFIFATINVAVTETANIQVEDISTLTKFEAIEGLVAAGYSTFFGTVEALFPPRTTIEDSSSGSHDVSAFIVLSGPPLPPQPWGPFEVIVGDYTYTAVVDIFETTSSDEVYQPIEPEEGG